MTDTQRETIARTLLADLVAGRFEEAGRNFDAAMLNGLPPAKLKTFAQQLDGQVGNITATVSTR